MWQRRPQHSVSRLSCLVVDSIKMPRFVSSLFRRSLHIGKVLCEFHATSWAKATSSLSKDAKDILMDDSIDFSTMHSLMMAQASRSVMVQRKGPCSPSLDYDTETNLRRFGDLKYFSSFSSTPEKCRYLVEFSRKSDLSNLLNSGRDGAIENHMIEITETGESGGGVRSNNNDNQETKQEPKTKESELKNVLLSQETMDDQVKLVVEWNAISTDDIRCRYLFLHVLDALLKKHLRIPFQVFPFGSGLTGTGMPGSDLDVLILTRDYVRNTTKALPKEYHLIDTESEMRRGFRNEGIEILKRSEKILQDCLDVNDMMLLLSARVPVLKFEYPLLNLSVDIVVNLFHGHNFSSLISWYIRFDNRVLPVLFIIRKWAEGRSMLSHGIDYDGFTPFMLQMTVLVYLIRFAIIPPMKSVGKRHRDKLFIPLTPKHFVPKSQNPASVSDLISGFFDYFSAHGLQGKRLCCFHGSIRPRRHDLQSLWIANPFNSSANIAAHCTKQKVREMEKEIQKTARILCHRLKKIENRDWGIVSILSDYKT